MKSALFCLALLALPACSLFHPAGEATMAAPDTPPPAYEPIVFAASEATPAERAACEAAGGVIRPGGRRQWENCVQPFADAGKACSGDTDCVGKCYYEGRIGLAPGAAAMGTCQHNDAGFGCNTAVENGKIARTLCAD